MGRFGRRGTQRDDAAEPPAEGWDAIDAALRPLYGDQQPLHVAVGVGVAFGAPLQGISAYARPDHWHLVTYGLTELFDKQSDDPDVSGWGYELTLRVRRSPEDGAPPDWAWELLVALARGVQEHSHPHHVGWRGEVGAGPLGGRSLTAVALTVDPELAEQDSPHGRFAFWQVVGVTAGELERARAEGTGAVLDALRADDRLLVTDPARR